MGYPTTTQSGQRVTYQLRVVDSSRPLPNAARFCDVHVRSGTHVLLESEESEYVTVPVETQRKTPTPPQSPPALWQRRAFLAWTFATFAVVGAGSGMTTALARRNLIGRQKDAPISTVSPTYGMAMPRGATPQLTFSAHQGTVRTVAWSPDGNAIASGADDSQVLLWEANTGKVVQRIAHTVPVLALSWSPEGQRLVTGSGSSVAFFNVLTGTLLARSTHHHTASVSSIAWASNNQMQVVSGGIDKQAFVWDSTTYQPQQVFARHDTPIEAVTWGSDGMTVASASQGGAIRIWNGESDQEIHSFYQDAPIPMRAGVFAPIGSSLAIGGDDGIIRVWGNGFVCQHQHVGNDGPMCQDSPLSLTTSNSPLRSLAWSPDARYLASGSDDGTFSVWSPGQSNTHLFTAVTTPGIALHSLSWSPSGNQIAVASGNSVTLWELHS